MNNKGFTLIEIMIVIAIMGILVAIAIPSYFIYLNKANKNACLEEAKSYSNNIYYLLSIERKDRITIAPEVLACIYMTDASAWDETTTDLVIEAKSKNSSAVDIRCDLEKGATCVIIP